jgi:hypothetical protein
MAHHALLALAAGARRQRLERASLRLAYRRTL